MIERIKIENYRSCLGTEFQVHPQLSVLIGPNGSGKTNVLHSLLLLRKLAEELEGLHRYTEPEGPTARSDLKVWFNIQGKQVILTASVDSFTDENNNDVVVGSEYSWYLKSLTGRAKRYHTPLWFARLSSEPQERQYLQREYLRFVRGRRRAANPRAFEDVPESAASCLATIAQYVAGMRYYSASQFTNSANCPVSFEIEKEGPRSRGLRIGGHAKFLFDLYTEYKAQSQSYKQFFDIIGPRGIGLIDDLTFKDITTSSIDYSVKSGGRVRQRKREKQLVIPQCNIGRHELSPNQLSEGTFKTITLLFYIITEASSLLLIEEPEVCVHHGLLTSIVELIKTYSHEKQIVMSTHSDFVLDQVSSENVYRVSSSLEGGTKVMHIPRSMSKRELAALRRYLDSEGNLGEYWRAGGLES